MQQPDSSAIKRRCSLAVMFLQHAPHCLQMNDPVLLFTKFPPSDVVCCEVPAFKGRRAFLKIGRRLRAVRPSLRKHETISEFFLKPLHAARGNYFSILFHSGEYMPMKQRSSFLAVSAASESLPVTRMSMCRREAFWCIN